MKKEILKESERSTEEEREKKYINMRALPEISTIIIPKGVGKI